jgi:hypothetical protein
MDRIRKLDRVALAALLLGAGALAGAGCTNTPVDLSRGPAPLREPPPDADGEPCCFEEDLTGGQVFSLYCGYCHNARSLAERPFSNYKNVAAHMRARANLTGEEYAKLVAFLRRWHDVPPPNPPVEPSPKRLIFSQPTNELREKKPEGNPAPARRRTRGPAGRRTTRRRPSSRAPPCSTPFGRIKPNMSRRTSRTRGRRRIEGAAP